MNVQFQIRDLSLNHWILTKRAYDMKSSAHPIELQASLPSNKEKETYLSNEKITLTVVKHKADQKITRKLNM